jgi:hypothetical protein
VQEISVEIFKADPLKLAVSPDFWLTFWSTNLLDNDCIDVCKNILVVLVFTLGGLFPYFLLFLLTTFTVAIQIFLWRDRRIFLSLVSLFRGRAAFFEKKMIFNVSVGQRMF